MSIFFTSQSLRGHFLNHRYRKNVQGKIRVVHFPSVHGESRFLPLIIVETTPMPTATVMTLLGRSAELHLLLITQLTNPHVDNIFGLAVQIAGNTKSETGL